MMMDVNGDLARAFIESHPDEAAAEMERLGPEEAAALLETLPVEQASRMLSRLASAFGVECLRRLPEKTSGEILGAMPRDAGAVLLRRLPAPDRERFLAMTPAAAAAALARLSRYPEGTVGALMDTEVLSIPSDAPASAALEAVRSSGARILNYIYVVDRGNRLVGVMNLRELMATDSGATMFSVMHTRVERVSVYADRAGTLAHPAWRDFHALPVVDDTGLLVGVLRHKRLRGPEDEESAESSNLLSVGVALGEMYWSVAGQLLESLWSRAAAPAMEQGKSPEIKGGVENHDR